MSPTELARIYMKSFFGEKPLEEMRSILAEDLKFTGPFYKYDTANDYIESLADNMLANAMPSEILQEHENKNACCIVYQSVNQGKNEIMAQLFEVEENKIIRIRLLLNASKLLKD